MKIVKMAAIATMALTLFASCKKDEPKKEITSICIRLNDAELRAFEDPINAGAQGLIATDMKVIINDGAETFVLDDAAITAAKGTGWSTKVKNVPTKVTITGNGVIKDQLITTYQKMGTNFTTKVPLKGEATGTGITKNTTDPKETVYSVEITPVPELARLEVSGKIVGQENPTTHQNAYKSITVNAVYMNNYKAKGGSDVRTLVKANGTQNGFASTPEALMMDNIADTNVAAFEGRTKVAGYQLFPETADELTKDNAANDYYNHVVLRLTIKYDTNVAKNLLSDTEVGYLTIVSFYETTKGDLNGLQGGTIYKLNLADLSKEFKTKDNGDPDTPVTPGPEPENKKLIVKVNPYVWKAKDIKPNIIKK